MVVECILYDGLVPTTEADEYLQIANLGGAAVDITVWNLRDVADGTPTFTFPAHILPTGARVRVYTNQEHPEWGGFSFRRGTAIWSNSPADPDVAGLFNSQGQEISRGAYPPGCPGA